MSNAIIFKVEYITNKFDLTVAGTASEFKFQLYNFLSAAVDDNASFYDPYQRLKETKALVGRRGLPSFQSENAKRPKRINPPTLADHPLLGGRATVLTIHQYKESFRERAIHSLS
jgi:hypothetical protein